MSFVACSLVLAGMRLLDSLTLTTGFHRALARKAVTLPPMLERPAATSVLETPVKQ